MKINKKIWDYYDEPTRILEIIQQEQDPRLQKLIQYYNNILNQKMKNNNKKHEIIILNPMKPLQLNEALKNNKPICKTKQYPNKIN